MTGSLLMSGSSCRQGFSVCALNMALDVPTTESTTLLPPTSMHCLGA